MFRYVREYGEPGIIHSPSTEVIFNPCVEISLVPSIDGESGFAKCNLTEITGRYCDNKDKFFECCRASAILGTMQAVYTDFHYLTDVTKRIVEKEALLGCSITGIMDNSEILLDPDIQVAGAKIIKETNEKVAKMLGINLASRLTTAKPAGSTSVLLQTASGIHPHHSRRYLRRVQANKMEFSARYYQKANPSAVENSVWSANDSDLVISFACEVPPGAILKNQIGAIEFLEMIKATRANWIEAGTRDWLSPVSGTRHNVSCTVVVKDDEWDDVEKYVYKNKQYFGGISFLPFSGDLDYSQAPFASILTPREMVDEYGDASVLGSGLVVDGLSAFDGDLWAACSTSLGYGEKLDDSIEEPVFPVRNGKTLKEHNVALVSYYQNKNKYDNWFLKKDWIRRVRQFADRYFDGNLTKCTYCLKHLALWHKWLELKRTIKPIDWATIVEDDRELVGVDTLGAQACSGGACEIL
jgi:ribonucleoside-diphosphate reductase alpha chain